MRKEGAYQGGWKREGATGGSLGGGKVGGRGRFIFSSGPPSVAFLGNRGAGERGAGGVGMKG